VPSRELLTTTPITEIFILTRFHSITEKEYRGVRHQTIERTSIAFPRIC
jgi:hypothetical protein